METRAPANKIVGRKIKVAVRKGTEASTVSQNKVKQNQRKSGRCDRGTHYDKCAAVFVLPQLQRLMRWVLAPTKFQVATEHTTWCRKNLLLR